MGQGMGSRDRAISKSQKKLDGDFEIGRGGVKKKLRFRLGAVRVGCIYNPKPLCI